MTVPPGGLCATTVHVDTSLADPDLEQLLAQLLRMLSRDALTGVQGSLAAKENTGDHAAPLPAVSASEARALIALLAARGIAQGQLAELLGLEKSTVSRLAAGLERKGWIRRGRDEGNHRYVRLYLTPQGGLVAGHVWQAWQAAQADGQAHPFLRGQAGQDARLARLPRLPDMAGDEPALRREVQPHV